MRIYTLKNGGSMHKRYGYFDKIKDLLVILTEKPNTKPLQGINAKIIKQQITNSSWSPRVYKKVYLKNMTFIQPDW